MLMVSIFVLPSQSDVFAATSGPITGWAWSDNVGWVSLHCQTGGPTSNNICGTSNYGLTLESDGDVTGYAWSDSIGWVQFGGLSGFPGGVPVNDNAKFVSNNLVGWARAILGATTFTDGITYTTPGSYTFVVPPDFVSMTVKVWGAGGGGGSNGAGGSDGFSGSASTLDSLSASGGQGGRGGYSGGGQGGAGGTATGGTVNTPGNAGVNTTSAAGGAGGSAPGGGGAGGAGGNDGAGTAGGAPGAGGGGGGGGGGGEVFESSRGWTVPAGVTSVEVLVG